jgi:Flp pilus assembly pilin Flp
MKKSGRKGQGLVEYILVVFLMAIVCIVAVRQLSTSTQNGFSKASTKLDTEFNGG